MIDVGALGDIAVYKFIESFYRFIGVVTACCVKIAGVSRYSVSATVREKYSSV